MHRTNLSKADVSGSDAPGPRRIGRLLGSEDLLDPATELTLELMIEEPANNVYEAAYSGAYPSLSDATSEFISELDLVEEELDAIMLEPELEEEAVVDVSDEALCEEEPAEAADAPAEVASVKQEAWELSLDDDVSVDVSATQELSADEVVEELKMEQVDALVTADLEVLADQQRATQAAATDTVLFYCRPGESLPPGAEYAEELPRFAISSKRKAFAQLRGCAGSEQRAVSPLPSFQIEESAQRKSRLPPLRLPKFILD